MCSWNPMIFEDYWRQHPDLGTTVIPTCTEWTTNYGLTNLTTIPHLLLQWSFRNFMHWQQMLWQRYVTLCSKLAHTSSSMMLYLTLLSNIIMFQTLYSLFFLPGEPFQHCPNICINNANLSNIYKYLSSTVPELWMLLFNDSGHSKWYLFGCALCFHVHFFHALYNIFKRTMVWCLYLVH
jgi:hypothetical protein